MRARAPSDSPSRLRARRTIAALDQGQLPPDLVERLGRRGAATSALSTSDAAALASIGGEPLALVSGASVIRPLHQPMPSPSPRRAAAEGSVQELTVRSESLNVARGRALRRLRDEAKLAGANAVIGIRIRRAERHLERGEVFDLVEVVATGTAVRLPQDGRLVLTPLAGSELATLARTGWRPVDLFASSTVCYVVSGRATIDRFGLTWAQGGTNSEYGDYTRGVYFARSRALGRVEAAARKAGAGGLIGVTYEQTVTPVKREGFGTRDLEVTLHVVATGVSPAGTTASSSPLAAVSVG